MWLRRVLKRWSRFALRNTAHHCLPRLTRQILPIKLMVSSGFRFAMRRVSFSTCGGLSDRADDRGPCPLRGGPPRAIGVFDEVALYLTQRRRRHCALGNASMKLQEE